MAVVLFITVPWLVLEKVEDKQQFEAYLNEFYKTLDDTHRDVEAIQSNPDEMSPLLIDQNLEKLNSILRLGNRTINNDIQDQPRFFVGRISADEVQQAELEKVEEGLSYMLDKLHSEETGQENPDLTVEMFGEIIEKGASIGN
ncbi:hypothetical protein [Aquisalibacillus elongatus]|uniref:Uncharacterized protein n=1 Tax=Aquisalibacillus elongatus TaxID=485577 RepID=A0A3N5B1C4_9BACI|nr:hypothetical protein [Aquisalibacillus elongatus]RPF51067.1 hypothetical protein EDC24_2329 [Aquisalibacillus elongatus]